MTIYHKQGVNYMPQNERTAIFQAVYMFASYAKRTQKVNIFPWILKEKSGPLYAGRPDGA